MLSLLSVFRFSVSAIQAIYKAVERLFCDVDKINDIKLLLINGSTPVIWADYF